MGAGKQRSRERRVKGTILLAMPEQQKTIAARHDAIARSRQWRLSAVSPVAARPGEGPLTQLTAGVQLWRQELAFMPHSGR
jgi:hypothetical protein